MVRFADQFDNRKALPKRWSYPQNLSTSLPVGVIPTLVLHSTAHTLLCRENTLFETMFAMSALVGTPVVAAPVRATKTVRSTRTVAIFKSADKKDKKKVSKGMGVGGEKKNELLL